MASLYRYLRLGFAMLALSSIVAPAQDRPPDQKDGQQSAPAPRPRIGLALSGGGALGLAEIGVLQWLEENHIPVDRVAGTSMGSIIGAMYASGMSPAEIREFAESIDWITVMLPEPTYADQSFRRKQDRRDYQVDAPLGLKHGLEGPNGFNAGHGIGLLLDRIAFPESGLSSFDDLPLPFRCVATDMLTGDRVVLHDGSLAMAVRASMAIPGVFTPVEISGRVLADGGMVENIPVTTVREMGVEAVIAVDLKIPLGQSQQLESLSGVLSRALDVTILQNERRSLALANAVVTVDTGTFVALDYSRVADLVRLGYQSANAEAATLRSFALQDESEWQQYLAMRAARKRSPPKYVQAIEIVGGDSDEESRMNKRLKSAIAGPLNLPAPASQLPRSAAEA